jgi:FdhD protein
MTAPASSENQPRERQYEVVEFSTSQTHTRDDHVVIEEPIEIRVVFGPPDRRTMRSVSITMRTPGHDQELAAGFLLTEDILNSPGQIAGFGTLGVDPQGRQTGNIIRVDVKPEIEIELGRLQRHFFTTSSCGVCGKASLDALEVQGLMPIADERFRISAAAIRQLPEKLRASQRTFQRTGGLHAAGLADDEGRLIDSREDVGRHNAVDKLIGRCFLDQKIPLTRSAMIVSGRVSFEIMQKALVAGLPLIVAVGAPSSLAIDMARQYNMTLVGFASSERFNVYAGRNRIA